VLLAEAAVFLHFEAIRIVPAVLHRVIVALLALAAGQRDLNAHGMLLLPSRSAFACKTKAVRLRAGRYQIILAAMRRAVKQNRYKFGQNAGAALPGKESRPIQGHTPRKRAGTLLSL
jgi:hypothetical protein